MSNTETCPACHNRGPTFTIACSVDEAGRGQCRESLSACDFCGGLGIVESEVAERWRRGDAIRKLRKKSGLTLNQQAHILRIRPELLNDIEWGRAEWPAWVSLKLLAEYGYA
jgi:ribosome-binding protein aMBF1 (putative translation factor)